MKIKDIKKRAIVSLLTLTELFTLSSCAKKVDCDIEKDHVHLYISEDGLERYSAEEKDYLNATLDYKYNRTDRYKYISTLEEKYYEFINKNDLIDIDNNYEILSILYPKEEDYILYQYKRTMSNGKTVYVVRRWTKDPNHSRLTGIQKTMSFGYKGYKVYYDEETKKYAFEESKYYNTLDELIAAGYNCIKLSDFYSDIEKDEIVEYNSLKLENKG